MAWISCGRPCAARARRCSSGRSHGPAFSLFGRYGRYDSFSLDGNHVLRLTSRLMLDGAAAQHRADPAYAGAVAYLDLDDLAFLFRQVRIYFSHRCDIPSDWFSRQFPI